MLQFVVLKKYPNPGRRSLVCSPPARQNGWRWFVPGWSHAKKTVSSFHSGPFRMREQLGLAGLTIRGGAFFVMALAAGVGLAQADMTFTLGNVPQANEENILLNSGDTGATVFGTTNQSGLSVSFSSIA